MQVPRVSVIVPTFNRARFLGDLLASLAEQTLSPAEYDVIVVDDGSTDDTAAVAGRRYRVPLCYYRKPNAGDAAARNYGACLSRADLLLFLDDDMVVGPTFLEAILRAHAGGQERIVTGTAALWLDEHAPPPPPASSADATEPVPFVEVCSNNMSLRREAYFAIGMMNSLGFSGSSIWCDVEFSYRAYVLGYEFLRVVGAPCWHRDHVARSVESSAHRMRQAAFRAATLFQIHPGLPAHLPMFGDILPIDREADPRMLVARKLARRFASTDATIWLLGHLLGLPFIPAPAARVLARWLVGAHIFQGYREGLRSLTRALPATPRAA